MTRGAAAIQADLRAVSYEEWLSFVFGRPATRRGKKEWYRRREVRLEIDPSVQLKFLKRLVRAPGHLATRFSAGQIEDGMWFMFGPAGQEWFLDLLWDSALPWNSRRAVLLGVPRIYSRLFRRVRVDTAGFMLWDLIAGARPVASRASRDRRRVEAAARRALGRMLASRHGETVHAALHGLGHFEHPESLRLVRRFLRDARRRRHGLRRYAQEVLEGRSM